MTHDIGLCTSNQKWMKTKMRTLIFFNSKESEIIAWCSLVVWSCFLLKTHHHCMCYCCRCLLHYIYSSRVNNGNILKSFLVIRIFTCCYVWQGKKWENSFWTCASLFKTIAWIVSWNTLWTIVYSFLQGHQSKWVPRLLMLWWHWQCEKWATIKCDKLRRIHNVIKKWTENKQNARVIGWTNNQMPIPKFTHDKKRAHMISERALCQGLSIRLLRLPHV
jgi:hypothetical protein